MNTITFCDNTIKEYKTYDEFSEALDVLKKSLKNSASGYVNYHDAHGDTHVCEFRVWRGGVQCCGLFHDLLDSCELFDSAGNYSWHVYQAAGDIVKYAKDDFCGWTR